MLARSVARAVGAVSFFRLFVPLTCPRPREATGHMGRDKITVGQIPMIDRELAAIRRTIPGVESAGWNTIVLMKIAAPPDQLATGPAPPALARAPRQARLNVARPAHVPEQPSGSAQEQFQPHPQFGFRATHRPSDPAPSINARFCRGTQKSKGDFHETESHSHTYSILPAFGRF